jgi:hypothetical protein
MQYAQPAFRGAKPLTEETEEKKQSNHVQRILTERKKDAKIDPLLEAQFKAGRLLAVITSRPGQSGRCDGYILEGKELDVSDTWIVGQDHADFSSSTTGSSRSVKPSTLLRSLRKVLGSCRLLYQRWIDS